MTRSTRALIDAQKAFGDAVEAGAEEAAPYEFTLGFEYIKKAREEAGYSDYQKAEQLAEAARSYLETAKRRSKGDAPIESEPGVP